jgi:hypothetical protein
LALFIIEKTDAWAGHMARMSEKRIAYMLLVGNLKERDNFEDIGRDGRIILKCNFKQ